MTQALSHYELNDLLMVADECRRLRLELKMVDKDIEGTRGCYCVIDGTMKHYYADLEAVQTHLYGFEQALLRRK